MIQDVATVKEIPRNCDSGCGPMKAYKIRSTFWFVLCNKVDLTKEHNRRAIVDEFRRAIGSIARKEV